jgi:heat shock protein HslJ
VNGFTGCNTFLGSYETRPPDRLLFSKVAATQKLCPDMEVETMMFEVLGSTDSYAIRDGALRLHRGRMAPLAVFEPGPAR